MIDSATCEGSQARRATLEAQVEMCYTLGHHTAGPFWPRKDQKQGPELPSSSKTGRRKNTSEHVFIFGNFVLDRRIRVDCSLAELRRLLGGREAKIRMSWEQMPDRPGGFPVQAARVAKALGMTVHLGGVLPDPLPDAIERFLNQIKPDLTLARFVEGPCTHSLIFECTDGELLLCGPGHQDNTVSPAYDHLLDDFPVLLINPGPPAVRAQLLPRVVPGHNHDGPTVGICMRGDWTREDLERVKDRPCWLFLNEAEAIGNAERLEGRKFTAPHRAGAALKRVVGSAKLVTTLGSEGAIFFNGQTRPTYFPVVALKGRTVGAGDALTATTTIARHRGFPEVVAVRLGVDVSSGFVAGLPYPACLDEVLVG